MTTQTPRSGPSHGRRAIFLLAFSMTAVALAGCLGGGPATGSVSLYVKDALTDDVAEVHVRFTGAEVYSEATNWTQVFSGDTTIELLSLNASDAKALLAEFSIPPGEYEQLRITLQNVTVVDHNGTASGLLLLGDSVTVAEDFNVTAGEDLAIVVDFGLDEAIDIENGTFTPYVADVQTSEDDADGDGIDDVDDTDDDGDGIEDADDDDRDGDGRADRPHQRHHLGEGALAGLCNAWRHHADLHHRHAEHDHRHGNDTDRHVWHERWHEHFANSTAFRALAARAHAANTTLQEFCEDRHPGRSGEHRDDDRREAREEADRRQRDAEDRRLREADDHDDDHDDGRDDRRGPGRDRPSDERPGRDGRDRDDHSDDADDADEHDDEHDGEHDDGHDADDADGA